MRATSDDINLRGVLWSAGGLIVVTVMVYVIVGLLFAHFSAREAMRTPRLYPLASTQPQLPPQPRLQADPGQDLRALRQRDEAILSSYAWVNEQKGVVRIPIERAMAVLLERGLPVGSAPSPLGSASAATPPAKGLAR